MLVNSLLNLPNLLSNIDPLRFLFWDYCSKSGLNLAKMGLVLCHFNLLIFRQCSNPVYSAKKQLKIQQRYEFVEFSSFNNSGDNGYIKSNQIKCLFTQ